MVFIWFLSTWWKNQSCISYLGSCNYQDFVLFGYNVDISQVKAHSVIKYYEDIPPGINPSTVFCVSVLEYSFRLQSTSYFVE